MVQPAGKCLTIIIWIMLIMQQVNGRCTFNATAAAQRRSRFLNFLTTNRPSEAEHVKQMLTAHRDKFQADNRQNRQFEQPAPKPILFDNIAVAMDEDINVLNEPIKDYMYQGDIMLTKEQAEILLDVNNNIRQKRQAYRDRFFPNTIWTVTVPFSFDGTIDAGTQNLIRASVQFWQSNTCINFQENGSGPNKIVFTKGGGCFSNVGRVFNAATQAVSIGQGCEHFGIITHEIGHALGFFHEQSRYDRDTFISVNTNNIAAADQSQFNKESSSTNNNYGVAYDYGSVMHYSGTSFAMNKNTPVITAADGGYKMTMGSRIGPSFDDVKVMNTHYSCNACSGSTLACQQGGYPNPRNCAACVCPLGFGGTVCQSRQAASDGSNNGATVTATANAQTLSGQVGNGQMTTQTYHTQYFWHITSPPGTRIQVTMNSVGKVCSDGCFFGGVELKTKADMRQTGYRFCCPGDATGQTYTSDSNLVVIHAFNRYLQSNFQLQYRFVGTSTGGGATTIGAGACIDTAGNCAANSRLCNDPVYASLMSSSCAATCGRCTVAATTIKPASACVDNSGNCVIWKSNGFCDSGIYTAVQKAAYCQLSCNLC